MRLTFRALLNYMDNVLEAKDAQEIAAKLEESEFARNLLNRTRDLVRRMRLPAPDLTDQGQGLDANSVAEYLDNTLPSDRVADFERVCLESDIHLAEVASCHQILALVLGEPAEVDANARQRIYQLAALDQGVQDVEAVAMAAVGSLRVATPLPAPPTVPVEKKEAEYQRPEVPDYLRNQPHLPESSSWLPVAAAVLLGLLLMGLVLGALGQFEPGTPLGDLARRMVGAPLQPEAPAVPAPPPTREPSAQGAAENVAKAAAGSTAAPTTPPEAPKSEAKEKPAAVVAKTKPAGGSTTAAPAAAPPSTAKSDTSTGATLAMKSAPAVAQGTATAPAAATMPAKTEVASLTPAKPNTPVTPDKPVTTPPPAVLAPTPVLPSTPVGRLVSDKQVLLENDATAGWRRMPAQAAVKSGIALLSLPGFQPVVTLQVPLTVQWLGGTELEFLPATAENPPGIELHYGRIVLRSLGAGQPKVRLQIGRQQGVLTFLTPDATAGLTLSRVRAPGSDPERAPGVLRAELYAASGQLAWSEGAAPPQTLGAPAVLKLVAGETVAPVPEKVPDWIASGDELSALDKRAVPRLEQTLQTDRSVLLGLRELVGASQREVAWLAIRSLGHIGQFELMVSVFGQAEQRAVWGEYLAQLQAALSRGPDVAAQIRQGFEKQYPAQATLLYRLLWGYSEKDLAEGAGKTLVEYLDEEELAFRVLAFCNLEKLTRARYGYQPNDPPNKRQTAVNRWKERLQTGLLAPRPGESKKPAAAAPAASPQKL